MPQLLSPYSFWIQFSNACFLLAGLHGDLLIIRVTLFAAYFLLVVDSLIGIDDIRSSISLDGLLWSSVSLYVHGSSLFNLILDERPVQLSHDENALWAMMYRTGGLSKRLFQTIVAPYLSVVDIPAPGITMNTDDYFYIIYNGQVRLQVVENNVCVSTRILVSASVFDAGIVRCTSLTPARLFRIAKDDMKKMAHNPLAKGVWQALLINNLSYVVESYLSEEKKSQQAQIYHDKVFRPLESWEEPKRSLAGSGYALVNPFLHFVTYVQRSFSPPWPLKGHPTGIRQTQLPPPPLRPVDSQQPPRFHRFSFPSWAGGGRHILFEHRSSESSSATNSIGLDMPMTSEVTASLAMRNSLSMVNEELAGVVTC